MPCTGMFHSPTYSKNEIANPPRGIRQGHRGGGETKKMIDDEHDEPHTYK